MEKIYNLRSFKHDTQLSGRTGDESEYSRVGGEYDVNIDFGEASEEWRRNKKQLSNGTFAYVCGMSNKNGKPCKRCESHRRFHVNKSK